MKDSQKGFTLIELMVVIVIIGILSALAVPKMFGTSAKAKAAEAPTVISSWETLESAHISETSTAGDFAAIGFVDPTASSKWFSYGEVTVPATSSIITATAMKDFGACITNDTYISTYDVATNAPTHTSTGTCASSYSVNF